MSARAAWGQVAGSLRLLRDVGPFVRRPLSYERAQEQIRSQLAHREDAFLHLVRVAVFGHAPSPYRRLLRHYGITNDDVVALVRAHGVEGALERLYDAGIRISLDEFKGRRPIERPGLRIDTTATDFDSPALGGSYTVGSGGSRGSPRRMRIDAATLAYEAAYNLVAFRALGVQDRPYALWQPVPPGSAGLKELLRQAMGGQPLAAWFSQIDPSVRAGGRNVFTRAVVAAVRHYGGNVPVPVYAPPESPAPVAGWLARQSAAGHPAFMSMPGSSAVRVCAYAREHGIDIAGTVFRLGGEPYTDARAEILASVGARGAPNYSMSELGRIGLACGDPRATDDVHLVTDKLALIRRAPQSGLPGIDAWYLTTLLPALPKIMLNVETGDHGAVVQRPCNCLLGEVGLTTHLHTIRSYEKLTTEGMHFTGMPLLHLIESVLPARFGGNPTDYQLVEHQVDGITRVSLVVSPAVGPIDESAAVALALDVLGGADAGSRMMAGIWEQAGTLRVVRREPYVTSAAKIQPLHVERGV